MRGSLFHFLLGICTLAFLPCERAVGQQDSTRRDTTRAFRLGEIEITGSATSSSSTAFTSKHLDVVNIAMRDAAVVAEFATLIPAAHLQTNSRGETLVYLRNAGERQVGVFFEGALLNVPWDNRVDLSLVPAPVIGGVTVVKGVPPMEYGANVIGGALNLTARTPRNPWSETDLVGRTGSNGRWEGTATHTGRAGRVSYTGSFSYTTVDGMAVAADADLPFSQPSPDVRTNTDGRVTNVFASGTYAFNNARVGLSVLHVDGAKGVAPESHLDPTVSQVRFWRYPDWRNTTVIVSGEGRSAGQTGWKVSGWVSAFAQDIESYSSADYTLVEERQEDDDLTFGSRIILTHPVASGVAKFAVNGLTSTHKQRDLDLTPSDMPLSGETFPQLEYQQHLLSLGAEYAFDQADALIVTVGASFDAMFTPKTGGKPAHDGFTDYSLTLGATYDAGNGWFLRAAGGRKARFPTMRELFGESLGRFLLNPDLTAESSILTEFAVGTESDRFSGEIIPFATFTSGTIDQQAVFVAGETATRRERINLEGSRVLGIELVGTVLVGSAITFSGHLTVMDVHRRQTTPDEPDKISEKPGVLGRLGIDFAGRHGTGILVESVYTGRAYSLDDRNTFVPLPTSLVFNIRLSQTIALSSWRSLEAFVRADNVTDQVVTPQLGLPAPGRTFSGGMKVTL